MVESPLRLDQEHRVMERRVDALPEKDVIDVAVTLKQLHLHDLLDRPVHLLRAAGRRAADAKDPDV